MPHNTCSTYVDIRPDLLRLGIWGYVEIWAFGELVYLGVSGFFIFLYFRICEYSDIAWIEGISELLQDICKPIAKVMLYYMRVYSAHCTLYTVHCTPWCNAPAYTNNNDCSKPCKYCDTTWSNKYKWYKYKIIV